MSPSAEPTSKADAAAYLVPANLLGDNEIIVLAIKPSGWFVLTASVPVLAAAAVAAGAAYVVGLYRPYAPRQAVLSFCAAVGLGRVLVACWQWIGRTYVLTNLRVVCVRGLVRVVVTASALVDLTEAVLSATLPERLAGVAGIYCLSAPDAPPVVVWNAVPQPQEVYEVVDQAVRRARHRQPPR